MLEVYALQHQVQQLLVHRNLVSQSSVGLGTLLEELLQEVGVLLEVSQLLLHILVQG